MGADLSRQTFDPAKRFCRVQFQQGRVQLDADLNEQSAILLHYLRTLAADLIGPHGGPAKEGFAITGDNQGQGYSLTAGRYYVDGVLCENDRTVLSDETGPLLPRDLDLKKPQFLYLEAWEREVGPIQDGSLREVALGGPDTALRSQVVWRVRATDRVPGAADLESWPQWVQQLHPVNRGRLKVQAKVDPATETDPCLAPPEARYRGVENQLYRVQIHTDGEAEAATFKWSRENGSVTFPVRRLQGDTAYVDLLGCDERFGLAAGDWVELLDDTAELTAAAGLLLRVGAVDRQRSMVTLRVPAGTVVPVYDEKEAAAQHVFLRRWDQKEGDEQRGAPKITQGAAVIVEGGKDKGWLTLEDGVQVQFQPGGTYRAGDYWLIPARTATGDVEWPSRPDGVPPHGVERHFAPLAIVSLAKKEKVQIQDLRKVFKPQALPLA